MVNKKYGVKTLNEITPSYWYNSLSDNYYYTRVNGDTSPFYRSKFMNYVEFKYFLEIMV